MRGTDLERYSILATARPGEETDLRHKELLCYRTRAVEAGPMLYVSAHPVALHMASAARAREKLGKATKESQQKINRTRATLRLEQYIHTNFTTGDWFITNTYEKGCHPETLEEVRTDVRKYIARLRRCAKRAGKELKYVYVIELSDRRDTDPNAEQKWHVHMVATGVSRDDAEQLWPHGYANTKPLQDSKERFTGITKYMLKRRASWRTWEKSRNLIPPKERVTDRQPSRRRVSLIARDVRVAGKEIFEKLYPGYELIEEVDVRVSDYVPGAYIYARLRKRGSYTWRGGTM